MSFIVYLYDNLVNGKVYIGITNDLVKRDSYHCGKGNPVPIDLAIKKYGRHNFILSIITEVDTAEQAQYAEIDWIARARNLLGKENVYNITDGGDGTCGIPAWNKGTKGIMKAWNKGIKGSIKPNKGSFKPGHATYNKGKTLTKQHRDKLSQAQLTSTKHVNRGKKLSEETKRRMSEAKKQYWANKKAGS